VCNPTIGLVQFLPGSLLLRPVMVSWSPEDGAVRYVAMDFNRVNRWIRKSTAHGSDGSMGGDRKLDGPFVAARQQQCMTNR
jgi:hypothetical protein